MLNLDARSVSIGDSDFIENILGSNWGGAQPYTYFLCRIGDKKSFAIFKSISCTGNRDS